jgi:molybdopterin-guanine dinucleotide biosynthesis protein
MKKCKYNDKARILQVSGDSMVGKTLFVEKAISYLLQRG